MTASRQYLWPKARKGQPNSDQLDPPIHTHFHPLGTKMVPSTTRPGGSLYVGFCFHVGLRRLRIRSHKVPAPCPPGIWSNNGFPLSSQAGQPMGMSFT